MEKYVIDFTYQTLLFLTNQIIFPYLKMSTSNCDVVELKQLKAAGPNRETPLLSVNVRREFSQMCFFFHRLVNLFQSRRSA